MACRLLLSTSPFYCVTNSGALAVHRKHRHVGRYTLSMFTEMFAPTTAPFQYPRSPSIQFKTFSEKCSNIIYITKYFTLHSCAAKLQLQKHFVKNTITKKVQLCCRDAFFDNTDYQKLIEDIFSENK